MPTDSALNGQGVGKRSEYENNNVCRMGFNEKKIKMNIDSW
jgi:hypothetical protein